MGRIIEECEKTNMTGKRIKDARLKANLSQAQLSAKLETLAIYVCRGSISRIENKERTVTDVEIDGISRILNVSLDYLFGRTE